MFLEENEPLRDVLLRNGFDDRLFELANAALRHVLNSGTMPAGARLRIFIGPSATSGFLIPYRLSIYFPDQRTGEVKHAATVALTDRGEYVLGLAPPAIALPDGDILGEPAPLNGVDVDDGRVSRVRPQAL